MSKTNELNLPWSVKEVTLEEEKYYTIIDASEEEVAEMCIDDSKKSKEVCLLIVETVNKNKKG